MDGASIVFMVWATVSLLLFFIVGAYRSYTKTEADDLDGLFILMWPMTVAVWLIAGICHAAIMAGARVGIWLRNVV